MKITVDVSIISFYLTDVIWALGRWPAMVYLTLGGGDGGGGGEGGDFVDYGFLKAYYLANILQHVAS